MESTIYYRIPYLGHDGGGSITVPYRHQEVHELWPSIETTSQDVGVSPCLLLALMLVETVLHPDIGPRFWRPLPASLLASLESYFELDLVEASLRLCLMVAAAHLNKQLRLFDDVSSLVAFHLGTEGALAATQAELLALQPYVRGVIATAAWLSFEAPWRFASHDEWAKSRPGGVS
jgi:hypothetical protein